jgi:hypothetical protein
MALFAIGTTPDTIPTEGHLGEAAYLDVLDLLTLLLPCMTLDQLRGTPLLTLPVVIVTTPTVRDVFWRDVADTTTPDDGLNVIAAADGVRYRRRALLRTYTPISSTDAALMVGELCMDASFLYMKLATGSIRKITHVAF